MAEYLAPGASGVQRRVLMHFLQVSSDGPSIAGFLKATFEVDVSSMTRRVVAPTLVVAGSLDETVPIERVRHLASLIPGARFEIVGGATHFGASGADPQVKEMITDFLAEAEPAADRTE